MALSGSGQISRDRYGLRIQMDLLGDRSFTPVSMGRFADSVSDFRPFWRDYAAPLVFDRIQSNFDSQGGWVGGWSPLSPTYKLWKVSQVGNKPILQFSGAMKQSLAWTGSTAGPGGIARITERQAEFGTSVAYALFHQLGTRPRSSSPTFAQTAQAVFGGGGQSRRRSPSAGRGLPKRQIIRLPESETMGRLLHRFVMDQLKDARAAARAVSQRPPR